MTLSKPLLFRMRAVPAAAATAAVLLMASCSQPFEPQCAEALRGARQLIVVTTPDLNSLTSRIGLYQRQHPDGAWTSAGPAMPAVVGSKGLGWARAFLGAGDVSEPVKQEGDKKSPAGVFAAGRPFGFTPSTLPNYLHLETGKHLCVDDVKSPHYGSIVDAETAGPTTSSEKMREVPVYRRGMIVDYPANAAHRSGSCIFFHIWNGPDEGTSGCVAVAETVMQRIQQFAAALPTRVVIWPLTHQKSLARCIPDLPIKTLTTALKIDASTN